MSKPILENTDDGKSYGNPPLLETEGQGQSRLDSPVYSPPSVTLTRRFRRPTTALQLAAQVSHVATALLNGDIDLETARSYGTIARTAAQSMNIEVQTGRFLKSGTELRLDIESVFEGRVDNEQEEN